MSKPTLLTWHDFIAPTGFGNVAKNLLCDAHEEFDVTVVAINSKDPYAEYDTNKYNTVVHTLSREDPLNIQALIDEAEDLQPDVIFLFQDIFNIDMVIEPVKEASPDSKIVSYFPIDGHPVYSNYQYIFKHSDILITYSDWAIDMLNDYVPNIDKPIYKLYHGVDTETFKPLGEDYIKALRSPVGWTDKLVFVNVNSYQPRKQVDLGIRAFSMFAKGYNKCEDCGHIQPLNIKSCELCMSRDLKNHKDPKDDVVLYLHMMPVSSAIGTMPTDYLVSHMNNAGLTTEDFGRIISINGHNINKGEVTEKQINEIYNAADYNISSTMGEGKLLTGTPVLTSEGYIPIENIKVDSLVMNDKGNFVKVNKTLATPFTKKGYKIKLHKFIEPLYASHDHPFLTEGGEYIEAKDLSDQNKVLFKAPEYKKERPPIFIDLSEYINSNFSVESDYIVSKKTQDNKKLNRYITIDEDTLFMFGLYVSEGSCNSSGIRFSLHKDEKKLHCFLEDYHTNRINIEGMYKQAKFIKSSKDNSGRIIFSGSMFAPLFKKMFGKDAHSKKFPNWIFSLPEDYRQSFINGLIAGDGDVASRGYVRYKTVSMNLAYSLRDLYLSLGKVATVRIDDNSKGFGNGSIYSVIFYPDRHASEKLGQRTRTYKIENGFVVLPIHSIKEVEIEGMGHDLEVPEGESYTLGQCTVHNCGLSLLESAAVGIESIAPKNSAIPEMLGPFGHQVKNIAVANFKQDNGHIRPLVDEQAFVDTFQKVYDEWVDGGRQKEFNQKAADRIRDEFLWDDKREFLMEKLTQALSI